jgi:hypothetical protein
MFMMNVDSGACKYDVYSGSIYPRYFKDKKLLLPVNSWVVATPKEESAQYIPTTELPEYIQY